MSDAFAWDELAPLWNGNHFGAVHDWLGARWSRLTQLCCAGMDDPDARFLQGLAFAALALHFTQHRNQEGAALLADDALAVLSAFRPAHRGLAVAPLIATLARLRPLLDGVAPDAECPMCPLVFDKLSYWKDAP